MSTHRRVTSLPYSRSATSRWHGYRVCDVQITVTGPVHRLQEVQRFLGELNDFTTLLTDFDETYDADNESDTDSEHTDYNLSDTTIEYVPETELDTTSTNSDCRIVDTDTHFDTQSTDTTPVLHDYSFLPQRHPQTTPKRPKTADDSTPVLFIYPTTDDTTPPLTDRETLKRPTATHNIHDSDSSDTTPLLHLQTDRDTLIQQKQPKRLFTSTDAHQEHR